MVCSSRHNPERSEGALVTVASPARLRVVAASLLPLAILAPALRAQDSTFVLVSSDPARAPSPFIGNGRIGLVIPALGVGASRSFLAGLDENAAGDVPRIAAVPGSGRPAR